MTKNRQMPIRITDQLMTEIDDFRRLQSDLPTRAEAVRRLVELGLRVAKEPRDSAGAKRSERLRSALLEIIELDHYPDATLARRALGMPVTPRDHREQKMSET